MLHMSCVHCRMPEGHASVQFAAQVSSLLNLNVIADEDADEQRHHAQLHLHGISQACQWILMMLTKKNARLDNKLSK